MLTISSAWSLMAAGGNELSEAGLTALMGDVKRTTTWFAPLTAAPRTSTRHERNMLSARSTECPLTKTRERSSPRKRAPTRSCAEERVAAAERRPYPVRALDPLLVLLVGP